MCLIPVENVTLGQTQLLKRILQASTFLIMSCHPYGEKYTYVYYTDLCLFTTASDIQQLC